MGWCLTGAWEHSELNLGTGVVMISSPKPEDHRLRPRSRNEVLTP
jgi:hypothetical protein